MPRNRDDSVSFVTGGTSPASSAQTLSLAGGTGGNSEATIQKRVIDIHSSLSVSWVTSALLSKQFAVTLVQMCPNGAHDLKVVFYSDFEAYIAKEESKHDERNDKKDPRAKAVANTAGHGFKRNMAVGRWGTLSKQRREVVGAMTGVLQAEGGEFYNPDGTGYQDEEKRDSISGDGEEGSVEDTSPPSSPTTSAKKFTANIKASKLALHTHGMTFGNIAKDVMLRQAARQLVSIDAPTFVNRSLRMLQVMGVINFSIQPLQAEPMVAALRWRQSEGPGLKAPMSQTECTEDYWSDGDEDDELKRDGMDGDTYFRLMMRRERRGLKKWERELRERWYILRDVAAVEGQLHYFHNLTVLAFCLYDLYLCACGHLTRGGLVWSIFVEYLSDCSTGVSRKAADHDSASDTVLKAMREEVVVVPFDDISRGARVIPWLSRNIVVVHEADRDGIDRLCMFDSSVLRPNRSYTWPSHYGKISQIVIASEINAILIATFDVVRVIDADNYVCKFSSRVEDPVTAMQWIPEGPKMCVVGTRAGDVYCFRLDKLDTLFFGGGSQCVYALPSEDVWRNRSLHTDSIAHISSQMLSGASIVSSSMDGTLTSWSLESGVVRRMVDAVALGFELLPHLGMLFAYGVELFPMMWACNVSNAKPIVVGGVKQGVRPHQARIIGVAALSYPRNSGVSVDRLGGIKIWDLWENTLLQAWSVMDHIPPTVNSRGTTFQSFYFAGNGQNMFIVSNNRMLCQTTFLRQEDAKRAPIASNVPIQCICHCPELRLFITAQRNSLTIWNAVTAGPIAAYEHVSPEANDEILMMSVFESPQREIWCGTKMGLVVTVVLGNGSIRSIYRHPLRKEIQCLVYLALLETLVVSCEGSAKSVFNSDEKSFTMSQKGHVGFADACLHTATQLLIAAHDDEVRISVWDVSPTTPNVWVRLADIVVPDTYLDKNLLSPSSGDTHGQTPRSGGTQIGCSKIADFWGTGFFAVVDTTSQVYICDVEVSVDDDGGSVARQHPQDSDSSDADNLITRATKKRITTRRKSTIALRSRAAEGGGEDEEASTHAQDAAGSEGDVTDKAGNSPSKSKSKSRSAQHLVRTVHITIRQIFSHKNYEGEQLQQQRRPQAAAQPQRSQKENTIPTVTALQFIDRFGLLYVADDLGYVTVYDVADVLIQALSSPHQSPRRQLSSATSSISSKSGVHGAVNRGLLAAHANQNVSLHSTLSNVNTTFKNTKPQTMDEMVLAEQLWGKTDMPFTMTLNERVAELSDALKSTAKQSPADKKKKRRVSGGGDDDEGGSYSSGTVSAVMSSMEFPEDVEIGDFLIDFSDSGQQLMQRLDKKHVARPIITNPLSLDPLESTLRPPSAFSSTESGTEPDDDLFDRIKKPSRGAAQDRTRPSPMHHRVVITSPQAGSMSPQLNASLKSPVHRVKVMGLVSPQHAAMGRRSTAVGISYDDTTPSISDVTPNSRAANAKKRFSAAAGKLTHAVLSPTGGDSGGIRLRFDSDAVVGSLPLQSSRRRSTRFSSSASEVNVPSAFTTSRDQEPHHKTPAVLQRHNHLLDQKKDHESGNGKNTRRSTAFNSLPPPPREVVQITGSVFVVHAAQVHPDHAVTGLLVLDQPITALVSCGKDRLVSFWTLFFRYVGRLSLSTDTQEPLYSKFSGMNGSGINPATLSGAEDLLSMSTSMSRSKRPSRNEGEGKKKRKRSMAPPPTNSGSCKSAADEANDWENLFCMVGDRMSIFDDIPKRFRVLARNPLADWQRECDRLLDTGGSTIGGGGAVDEDDTNDTAAETIQLPFQPVECGWFTALAKRNAHEKEEQEEEARRRQFGPVASFLSSNLKELRQEVATSSPSSSSPVGGVTSDPNASSFFMTGVALEATANTTGDHTPRKQQTPQEQLQHRGGNSRRALQRSAEDLRLTHEQKVAMCQDWFFGQTLALGGARDGRLVEKVMALKRMGVGDMDSIVEDVLYQREQQAEERERAAEQQRLKSKALSETQEMKRLFGSRSGDATGAFESTVAVSSSSGGALDSTNDKRNGSFFGDTVRSTGSSRVICVQDGEVLGSEDPRSTSPLGNKPPEDEAWLSRIVLRQLEPPRSFLPIPTATVVEKFLEVKRSHVSVSPPCHSSELLSEEREIAKMQAQHEYKASVLRWEMLPPQLRQEELASLPKMPQETFRASVLEPQRKIAIRDRTEADLNRLRSSLPPISGGDARHANSMWRPPKKSMLERELDEVGSPLVGRSAGGLESSLQSVPRKSRRETVHQRPPQRSHTSMSLHHHVSIKSDENDASLMRIVTPVQLTQRGRK